MPMCGFMVFLFKEGVIYKCLYPPSLTRICLSSHSFRITSAGYFPDYRMWDLIALVPDHCISFYFTNAVAKIIAVVIMYQAKLTLNLL